MNNVWVFYIAVGLAILAILAAILSMILKTTREPCNIEWNDLMRASCQSQAEYILEGCGLLSWREDLMKVMQLKGCKINEVK